MENRKCKKKANKGLLKHYQRP